MKFKDSDNSPVVIGQIVESSILERIGHKAYYSEAIGAKHHYRRRL
ncbi:MAG: hypothetical protein WA919_10365 [Coleofasciculaceae cyanobacterium]